jgi:DUF971 family protein
MPLEIADIQHIGNELAVRWNDGGESYLDLDKLRRACPCAGCGGEPDVIGRRLRPEVNYTARSFELTRVQPVGGYALQLRWADGHETGIYSFDYLRSLSLTRAGE